MRTSVLSLMLSVLLIAGCEPGSRFGSSDDPDKVDIEYAKLKGVEGMQACQRGDYRLAEQLFTEAIERDDQGSYHNNLGRVQYWLGKFSNAIDSFDKARELDGANADLLANLGDVYAKIGQTSRAIDCYHEALSLDNKHARSHFQLGDLCLKRNDYENALYRLDRALTINPQYDRARLARTILHRLRNDYENAYKDMKVLEVRGLEVDPELRMEILAGYQPKDGSARGGATAWVSHQ